MTLVGESDHEERVLQRARELAVADGSEWVTRTWFSEDVDEEADEIFSEYLEKARREIEGPKPTWQCESCGKFYSERTAKDHAACLREEDRRRAEGAWG